MKKTLIAVALTALVAGGAAYAGSLSDPIVAPEIVMADTVASSSYDVQILAALAVIVIILGAAGAF